jgi:hypothetical protein
MLLQPITTYIGYNNILCYRMEGLGLLTQLAMYFQLPVVNFMSNFSLHCLLSCHLLTVQTRLLVGNEQQPSCWPWWPQPRISVGHLACKIIVWLIYSVHYLFILTCILIPLLKPDSEGAHGRRQKEPQGWDTGPLCWRGSGSSHLFTWDSSTQKLNGWSTGPISEWTNAWSIYPVLHVLVSTSTSKKCPCVATGSRVSFQPYNYI